MTALLASMLLLRQAPSRPQPPEWLRLTAVYAIRLDRFENGSRRNDPPGAADWSAEPGPATVYGGDLEGLEKRWPHVEALGVKTLVLLASPTPEAVREIDRLADRAAVRVAAFAPISAVPVIQRDADREQAWRAAVVGFVSDPESPQGWAALLQANRVASARLGLNMVSDPAGSRILTAVRNGPKARRAATMLQFLMPGTPVVIAGDEVGMAGTSLLPMDWFESRWDKDLLKLHQQLITLRQTSVPLLQGSARLVRVGDNAAAVALVRERGSERVIAVFNRTQTEQTVRLDRAWAGSGVLFDLLGGAALSSGRGVPTLLLPPLGSAILGTRQ